MLLSEIDQKLLLPGLQADCWEEALDLITEKMVEYGYVHPSFREAVKQREREYPTGLTVRGGLGTAIPHAGPEHVVRPVTAVAALREPVTFRNMEGHKSDVSLILLQAIRDPSEHIDAMAEIIMLLRDVDTVDALMRASDPAQMRKVLERFEDRYDAPT